MGTHKISESEGYRGTANWVQFILARGLASLLQILPTGLAYRMGEALDGFRGNSCLASSCCA